MFDSFNPTASLIPNDGDLVFDATTGEGGRSPAETVLPYIEQRADPDTIYRDAGVVTTPDHADFTLGSPEENDGSSQGIIISWAASGPGDELTAGFWATGTFNTWAGHTAGEGSSQGIVINWAASGPGDELTAGFCATGKTGGDGSSHDAFPTETVHPYEQHALHLYDLVI
jgi:hypothetical protein